MPVMDISQTIERAEFLKRIKQYLVEGEDYGVIPGTDKPTLYKPGAEKVCAIFGYVPNYELMPGSIEDWTGEKFGEPIFYYHVKCTLSQNGIAVGQGTGSCNSWEKKYRYRSAQRSCPQCGGAHLIKGKPEYEKQADYKNRGAWICYEKKGGCGAKYYGDDPAIMGQQVGSVPNPEFADLINTVQKMADKRSHIAATLSATGLSQFFTQDMEDIQGSQEAADAVAQKKIAELNKGNGKDEAQQPQASVEDVPAAVLHYWQQMTKGGAVYVSDVLKEFRQQLDDLLGDDDFFRWILAKWGIPGMDASDLKGIKGAALKGIILDLYRAVDGARQAETEAQREADDAQVPGGLQGAR
jgi:hypothetical protein